VKSTVVIKSGPTKQETTVNKLKLKRWKKNRSGDVRGQNRAIKLTRTSQLEIRRDKEKESHGSFRRNVIPLQS